MFAMEELARIQIRFFRTALFSTVIIAGLIAQGLLCPYLYLDYPDARNLRFSIYIGVAVAAIAAGLAGASMCKLILLVMNWKKISQIQKMFFYSFCRIGNCFCCFIFQ